ncbi:MAG: RNA-binding protein, partial [Cytophagales bacterium]|nr:RNA-binding protein [Armatimonadota bacterium]
MRIYVGGLPYSADNEELRRLFSEAGNVTEATVVEDKYSGQSKGFGFVEMPDDSEARAAITKFNGFSMGGRALTVNEAKPREERGGGGGYGGGGGGRSGGGGGFGGGGGGRCGGGGGRY